MCENPDPKRSYRSDTIAPTEAAWESLGNPAPAGFDTESYTDDQDHESYTTGIAVTVERFVADHGTVVTFSGTDEDGRSVRLTVDHRPGQDIFSALSETGEDVEVIAATWQVTVLPGEES